ncbi:hypothetical protein AAG906_020606 [Vitis piasezkii]
MKMLTLRLHSRFPPCLFFSCYKMALKSPEKFSFSLCISSEWSSVFDDEGGSFFFPCSCNKWVLLTGNMQYLVQQRTPFKVFRFHAWKMLSSLPVAFLISFVNLSLERLWVSGCSVAAFKMNKGAQSL